jgi:hypothetical protein
MSSRSSGLSQTLRAPGRFVVGSVLPSGDCFYDCLHMQLEPSPRALPQLADANAMRDAVADSMTGETFELYKMFATAGIEGYEFMRHHRGPTTLDELRSFARRRGKEAGAGQCLWADEHALNVMSRIAGVRYLIFDEQAAPRGSRAGRRRDGNLAPDPRFVSVGESSLGWERLVLLHRSRRQHYSPVFLDGKGVFDVHSMPTATRDLWPALRSAACEEGSVSTTAAAAAAGDTENAKKRTKKVLNGTT